MQKAIIIIVLVLLSFLCTAVFFKVVSGEDCWMPDGQGGWVKHGVPAGPAPDYPSPIGESPVSAGLIATFIATGSAASGLSVYLYLRFLKRRAKK